MKSIIIKNNNNTQNPKYKNVPPSLHPLTPQEESLLDFYTQIQTYEKMAATKASRVAKERLMKKHKQLEESKMTMMEEEQDVVLGNQEELPLTTQHGAEDGTIRRRAKKRKGN